jgi:signal transduction histidine kinase
MLSQSGTERSFILDSSPIKNRSGTPTGQLVQLTEITEQKARERQLEEQNEDLDEFASIISHDLQSPLNVAKARLKLAKRESDDEQLAEVDEALTRMESLIDTLLTKARYSRTTDDFEPISVERVAKTARTYSDIDNCTLTTSISADVLIIANRDRLLALFQNLYENAGDHNEPPVNVRVGVIDDKTLATDDGEQTGFYIEDDGSGLSIDDQNKLFEKGYTTSSSGTGLGLAIVQEIVTAHDWEIAVTESEDGGARFEITGVEFTDE